MIDFYMWSALVRLSQGIIYSSLWIVIGCFVAGVFQQMIGPAKTREIFGTGGRFGLLRGWLLGMLLPVCSLGVIPIVRELHRAGVKRGTIIAFGLTAPLFNPMSVLYGLTLSDPIAIITFSFCSLVIVSTLGFFWDYFFSDTKPIEPNDLLPAPGIKRLIAVFRASSQDLVGASGLYILIGLVGSAIFAIMLEKGYLMDKVERSNTLAPVIVALIATPIYSTPLLVMSQIGGMFQHGNSIGAAFTLLILGAGLNLGLITWFSRALGIKRTLLFLVQLAVISIGLAYLIQEPLYPKGLEAAGHSHAFDVYSNPFHFEIDNVERSAKFELREFWRKNESGGTFLLGLLLFVGMVVRVLSLKYDLAKWLNSSADVKKAKFDVVVPPWILGCVCVVGLVISSVAGCYLYYPAPKEALQELTAVNTDCVVAAKTKDWESAARWIIFADDLSRRLEIGVFLRYGTVEDYYSAKAKAYREKLDQLKTSVETKNEFQLEEKAMDVSRSYHRMRQAFNELEE